MSELDLKKVGDLANGGFSFFIPKYQRGYRWEQQQVEDLLEDIAEFITKGARGIYCLQPLVVKKKEKSSDEAAIWEVIDGQQRLTTIYILLSYLDSNSKLYKIAYETREGPWKFLQSLKDANNTSEEDAKKKEKDAKKNIDFFHMYNARKAIEGWFNKQKEKQAFQEKFLTTLRDCVKFIWYETDEENPIKVFTRLNIGKIPLTDAELIKALFLNQSNFSGNRSPEAIRLCQQEIAMEWDQIEYTLQNDEFWLFIHDDTWTKPTRIDFILDLVRERNDFELAPEKLENLGNDEHQTFRYFYHYFQQNKADLTDTTKLRDTLREPWSKVKRCFQIFKEWYDDLELYHYVGYLVAVNNGDAVSKLLQVWRDVKDKKDFLKNVKDIKDGMDGICKSLKQCANLYTEYETSGCPKTQCRPLLLLFNIQTVINQNKALADTEKYGMGAFYKFPFHLFKRENWDVEHIDSNTGNDLDNKKDQQEWVKNVWFANQVKVDQTLLEKICAFLKEGSNFQELRKKLMELDDNKKDQQEWQEWVKNVWFANQDKVKEDQTLLGEICAFLKEGSNFQKLRKKLMKLDPDLRQEANLKQENNDRLSEAEKQMVWNFALLDSGTNRGYGNDLFQTKRMKIIGKDSGKQIELKENLEEKTISIASKDGVCAFVPPCTKNVFLKDYTSARTNLDCWSRTDAEEYKNAIKITLKDFGVYDSSSEKGVCNE